MKRGFDMSKRIEAKKKRIQDLEAREAQLKRQKALLKAEVRSDRRRKDNHFKILLGAAMLEHLHRGDWSSQDLLKFVNGHLTDKHYGEVVDYLPEYVEARDMRLELEREVNQASSEGTGVAKVAEQAELIKVKSTASQPKSKAKSKTKPKSDAAKPLPQSTTQEAMIGQFNL
jgi:electron transfer flavoprotein alpha/beta subunit